MIRLLRPGDDQLLERFLLQHAESSVFLRSNSRAAGLDYRGQHRGGQYVGAFEDGELVAVVCHTWRGSLLFQAPVPLESLVRECLRLSGREVTGLLGPWDQVEQARDLLGWRTRATRLDSKELLFALELSALVVPAPLGEGLVRCRRSAERDLPLLSKWRAAYGVETLGDDDSARYRMDAVRSARKLHDDRVQFALEGEGGAVLSMSAFNATLPDTVQIGGVYTPPQLRSRGYGRAVVAGSLLLATAEGATLSILFTDEHNPARKAYTALGYRVVGDYGLVIFAD